MKKTIATILAMILMLSLAACGGSNTSAPAATSPPATQAPAQETAKPVADSNEDASDDGEDDADDGDDAATEEYVTFMSAYIEAFDRIMSETIPTLLDLTNEIETDEDLQAWCALFIEAKNVIGQSADNLADMAANVPEEYQESHIQITIATAAVYDAMTGFESAVDASLNGDQDAFDDGIATFAGNITAAEELWAEAVVYE